MKHEGGYEGYVVRPWWKYTAVMCAWCDSRGVIIAEPEGGYLDQHNLYLMCLEYLILAVIGIKQRKTSAVTLTTTVHDTSRTVDMNTLQHVVV